MSNRDINFSSPVSIIIQRAKEKRFMHGSLGNQLRQSYFSRSSFVPLYDILKEKVKFSFHKKRRNFVIGILNMQANNPTAGTLSFLT